MDDDMEMMYEESDWSEMLKSCLIFLAFIGTVMCLGFYIPVDIDASYIADQCRSEVASLTIQLEDVTTYKNRLNRLLFVTQNNHKADIELMHNVMQSCFGMSHQSFLCQNQSNYLKTKYSKIQSVFEEDYKELEISKNATRVG